MKLQEANDEGAIDASLYFIRIARRYAASRSNDNDFEGTYMNSIFGLRRGIDCSDLLEFLLSLVVIVHEFHIGLCIEDIETAFFIEF